MISSWLEFYRQHRHEAILTVTRALHPECKNPTQLERHSRLSRPTFYATYKRLNDITFDQSLLADRDRLLLLDALAGQDKALPVIYCIVAESNDRTFLKTQFVQLCSVSRNRVEALLKELESLGVFTVANGSTGIYDIRVAGTAAILEGIRSARAKKQSISDTCSTSSFLSTFFKSYYIKDKNLKVLKNVLVEDLSGIDCFENESSTPSGKNASPAADENALTPTEQKTISLEDPYESASLKDKITWIVNCWNWFASRPGSNAKPVKFPKGFAATGEIPADSRVFQSIARWVEDYDWLDCVGCWQAFIIAADKNTFFKMAPHKDSTKEVWSGVTLGWLFGAYGLKPGLDRFEDDKYINFDEGFIPSAAPARVEIDDTFTSPFPADSDQYRDIVSIVEAFGGAIPDLPQVVHPKYHVDEDEDFFPTGGVGSFYQRVYRYVQSTGDHAHATFTRLLTERHKIIMRLAPNGSETPLEWLFGRDDDGKLRINKAVAGSYDRQFGITSLASMKQKVMDVVCAWNCTMLVTGGPMADPSDEFCADGTLTDSDDAIRLLARWIATTYEWRMKWKSKLRLIASGKLIPSSFEEFVAQELLTPVIRQRREQCNDEIRKVDHEGRRDSSNSFEDAYAHSGNGNTI